MTKVRAWSLPATDRSLDKLTGDPQVYELVTRTQTERYRVDANPEDFGYVNQRGLSRKHIFDSVKHSLQRLQLDYIDVLQCERAAMAYNTAFIHQHAFLRPSL